MTKKINKIAFIVATQYDNVGDLLINKCLINELSLHGEVYLDTKNVPSSFKNLLLSDTNNVFELNKISKYSFKGKSFFSLLRNNPGITHIFKSPGPFGTHGDKKVFLKTLVIGLIYKLFKLKGVKSYLVGNDIHYEKDMDRFCVKFFSQNTGQMLCRSHNNLEALKNIGLKNVDYIPDMCFGLTPVIHRDHSFKKHIGVSFRKLEDNSYHQEIIIAIKNVLNADPQVKITFFYQVERDATYNKELYSLFNSHENVFFNDSCLEWEDLSIYNSFDYTLSNRLHVLLLGVVHQVIPIALLNNDTKTQKINDIFNSVGMSELLFSHLDLTDVTNLIERYTELSFQVEEIRKIQREELVKKIANIFN